MMQAMQVCLPACTNGNIVEVKSCLQAGIGVYVQLCDANV